MICVGIGFNHQADSAAIVAAVNACLNLHQIASNDLHALATLAAKDGLALREAAQILDLPLVFPSRAALDDAAPYCQTTSQKVSASHDLPSVAEAAALAAIGNPAYLLGPKHNHGHVSCALAHPGRPA